MGRKCFEIILTLLYCTKYNEINVCHCDIHKHAYYKNDIKSANILYRGSHKSFPIHYVIRGKIFKAYFNKLTYLHYTEYNEIFRCHLDVQKHASCKPFYKYYKYFVYKLVQKNSNVLRSLCENF